MSSTHIRYQIMRIRIHRYFKTNSNMRHVEHYMKHCSIGDWFVLNLMAKNTNAYMYRRIIKSLAESIREHRLTKTATISIDNIESSKNGGGV